MRHLFLVSLTLLLLSSCASPGDDFTVAGPLSPPSKPAWTPDTNVSIEAGASDFMVASGTNTVFFETNKSVLTAQARDVLARQLSWLMVHRDIAFRIEGHCDERASSTFNAGLGMRRAEAVKAYFVAGGIRASRITTQSFGESSPVYDDQGDIQLNRRAVTVIN